MKVVNEETGEKLVVVCPMCQYGFETPQKDEYVCENPECGYRWNRTQSATLFGAFTPKGRKQRPELVFLSGEKEGRTVPIKNGKNLIGRDPDCEVHLTNLSVSRKHAEIQKLGIGCLIRDLDSQSGVVVNDEKVTIAELKIGDRILISGIEMEFRVRFEAQAESIDVPVYQEESGPVAIRQQGETSQHISLDSPRTSIGRGADRDVIIEHHMVSRRHAMVLKEANDLYIVDTKSSLGTFVNGRSIIRERLVKGDRVQVGPLVFLFDGTGLAFQTSTESLSTQGRNLTTVTREGLTILDDISLSIEPGELVGLIGPSGAGKTTLLDALSGGRPVNRGAVLYNGIPLQDDYEALKNKIGYVPQDDIIHLELTPGQALNYAARLRLPRNTPKSDIQELVTETLATLGLKDRTDVLIRNLSGGQRKRVSLGVELLTRCNVLFMDEPTSGLDPATEARMMGLFRRLADQGRTLVTTTHVMENIDLLDKIAVLYQGALVYFGPPDEAKKHFGIEKATSLYDKLEEESVEEWRRRFDTPDSRTDVEEPAESAPSPTADSGAGKTRIRAESFKQLKILTARYLRITLADRRNLALLVAQPLIIFLFICLTINKVGPLLFLSALSIFWVGCTNAAREIVKEKSVYQRERMVGQGIVPYVLSKVAVITCVCVVQTVLGVLLLKTARGIEGNVLMYCTALFTSSLSGMALGLFISALAGKSEHAQTVIPIALVPQIIFAGVIEAIEDMNPVSQFISYGVSTRWTRQSLYRVWREADFDLFWHETGIVLGFALVLTLCTVLALRLKTQGKS